MQLGSDRGRVSVCIVNMLNPSRSAVLEYTYRLPEFVEFILLHWLGPSNGGPHPAVVVSGQAASASGLLQLSILVPPHADSTSPTGI